MTSTSNRMAFQKLGAVAAAISPAILLVYGTVGQKQQEESSITTHTTSSSINRLLATSAMTTTNNKVRSP